MIVNCASCDVDCGCSPEILLKVYRLQVCQPQVNGFLRYKNELLTHFVKSSVMLVWPLTHSSPTYTH